MSKTDENETGLTDAALDDVFAAARATVPEPRAEVMARILADAEGEIDRRESVSANARPAHRFDILRAAIGGWPAMAGMATAAVTGLWIGVSAPDQLSVLSGGWIGGASANSEFELEELVPGYIALMALDEVAP